MNLCFDFKISNAIFLITTKLAAAFLFFVRSASSRIAIIMSHAGIVIGWVVVELDAMFYTEDWSSYSKVIPATRLTIEKQYTVGIEQNNSNIRHFLGRFTRRTKVVSKLPTMVLATLKICWHINENSGFDEYLKIFLSIFG